jgi:hypothetical protein
MLARMKAPSAPDSADTVPLRRANVRDAYPHLARELATIRAMVGIYCRDLHATDASLCPDCTDLMRYAMRRLDRCVFGDEKPTCARCAVHCYNETMRERVRVVMRHAGPRMMWRHPLLAIAHALDKRRGVPVLTRAPAAIVGKAGARGAARR